MKQLFDIQLPKLSASVHPEGSKELCAMELVAFMERLPHSDRPECTCPVIAAYVRRLNDSMDDVNRQRLLPYLSRLVDTVSEEHVQQRAEYIALFAVNVFAVKACEGQIDGHLVDAMQNAKTLSDAKVAADAAYAAICAAYAAAAAAAAGNAAYATAAAAAGNAVTRAERQLFEWFEVMPTKTPGARELDHAADAAAYAAYAAADADIWTLALQGLEGMLAIGPQSKVKWQKERADEALEYCLK